MLLLVKTTGKSDYFPAVCLSHVIDSRIDFPRLPARFGPGLPKLNVFPESRGKNISGSMAIKTLAPVSSSDFFYDSLKKVEGVATLLQCVCV